jgi:dihydrofolate reductase
MRRVRYGGAVSLDGYIAGPNGEFDWIIMDPEIDFAAMTSQFDTFLIGRKTFEAMQRMNGGGGEMPGVRSIVFSRTLKQADHPDVVIETDAVRVVSELRSTPGKDIAVFGGGELARSLLEAGLVDAVEVSVIPVLLGGGIHLLPPPASRTKLVFRRHRLYPKSGIVTLEYDVAR